MKYSEVITMALGYYASVNSSNKVVIGNSSVTTIGKSAFAENPLTIVTILGDETRFNDIWVSLGFPEELKPIE